MKAYNDFLLLMNSKDKINIYAKAVKIVLTPQRDSICKQPHKHLLSNWKDSQIRLEN